MKWSKWYHLQNILQLLYKSTTCSFSLRQFKILVCDVRKRVGGVTRTWEDGWNEYYVFSMFKDRRVKALLHREKTQEKYTAASYWIYWTMKTWSCYTEKRITKKGIAVYIYNSLSISWFMIKTKNFKRRELHFDLNTWFLFYVYLCTSLPIFIAKNCKRR